MITQFIKWQNNIRLAMAKVDRNLLSL